MSLAIPPIPEISDVDRQRMLALAYANRVRMQSAELRRRIKELPYGEGRHAVADLLEHNAPEIQAIPIGRLLRSIRGYRTARIGRLCLQADIHSSDRKCRDLTDRQRQILAVKLRWCG